MLLVAEWHHCGVSLAKAHWVAVREGLGLGCDLKAAWTDGGVSIAVLPASMDAREKQTHVWKREL